MTASGDASRGRGVGARREWRAQGTPRRRNWTGGPGASAGGQVRPRRTCRRGAPPRLSDCRRFSRAPGGRSPPCLPLLSGSSGPSGYTRRSVASGPVFPPPGRARTVGRQRTSPREPALHRDRSEGPAPTSAGTESSWFGHRPPAAHAAQRPEGGYTHPAGLWVRRTDSVTLQPTTSSLRANA